MLQSRQRSRQLVPGGLGCSVTAAEKDDDYRKHEARHRRLASYDGATGFATDNDSKDPKHSDDLNDSTIIRAEAVMETTTLSTVRDQLLDRRRKLETAAMTIGRSDDVARLLH